MKAVMNQNTFTASVNTLKQNGNLLVIGVR